MAMLNRVLCVAVLAGVLTGFLVTGLHMMWSVPLIHAAEAYETAGANGTGSTSHAHGPAAEGVGAPYTHAAEPWAPDDGAQRTLWTLIANILVGVGGGAILSAALVLGGTATPLAGLGFGAAAFAAFSLAPAFGLPPELPGTAAAALGARQAWWAGTVLTTLLGLGLAVYAPHRWLKAAGVLVLAVPHLIGAPHPEVHDALAPADLQREFIIASLTASAVFWVLLGGLTGFLARRMGVAGPAPASGTA